MISCQKEETKRDNRDCQDVAYESEFEIKLKEEACFPDGNSLVVEDIQHQFCPCGAICFWAGDLFIILNTESGEEVKEKNFYPALLFGDRSIFNNHEITSVTYSYLSEDGEVPPCAEDFEPEKVVLTMVITPL